MQLEELQQQWQRLDDKLERTLKLDSELLRLAVVRPARRRIQRQMIWPILDIAMGLTVMLFTGSFLSDHWQTSSLAAPAAAVMMAALMLLITSVHQLSIISELDWSGMVVDIQRTLSRLQLAKIRQFKWVILLSPLVGFCGLIVGLQWTLNQLPEPHSIFDKLNPWWTAANYVFGALFIPFGHAIIGFLARRFHLRGWWQQALADISGNSIRETHTELERWSHLDSRG